MPNKWCRAVRRVLIKVQPHCPVGLRSVISQWLAKNHYEIRPMWPCRFQKTFSIDLKTKKNESKSRKNQKANCDGTHAVHLSMLMLSAMQSKDSYENRHAPLPKSIAVERVRRQSRRHHRHRRRQVSGSAAMTKKTQPAIHRSVQHLKISSSNNTFRILSLSKAVFLFFFVFRSSISFSLFR